MRVLRSDLTKAELHVLRLRLSPAQKNVLVLRARREGFRPARHPQLECRYRSGDRIPGDATWEALRAKGLLSHKDKLTRTGQRAVDALIQVMLEDASEDPYDQ